MNLLSFSLTCSDNLTSIKTGLLEMDRKLFKILQKNAEKRRTQWKRGGLTVPAG